MSRRPRRTHSPAFKAKVALAAIKGEKTFVFRRGCGADSLAAAESWLSPSRSGLPGSASGASGRILRAGRSAGRGRGS